MSLTFRWLGTAGIELKTFNQVLVLDPFFTRPSLFQMLHPIQPDAALVVNHLPACNYVLVTHSHYDHLLDVPALIAHTGAVAYGSANTCQLLHILGVPDSQVKFTQAGDQLTLGPFQVQVINGQHSPIPFGWIFNGKLRVGLRPPLRITDFRMDKCLGFSIRVLGIHLLVCAADSQPADVVFAVAQESRGYYRKLFMQAQPHTFIPIHWDNFTRPLDKPLRRFTRPGRSSVEHIAHQARLILPQVKVIIPEIFTDYQLST